MDGDGNTGMSKGMGMEMEIRRWRIRNVNVRITDTEILISRYHALLVCYMAGSRCSYKILSYLTPKAVRQSARESAFQVLLSRFFGPKLEHKS